jgi:tryptophanyl-tRNA synthetase
MAADILIHNADFVPVGKDQEQHLEMTRIFAKRFNNMYKTEYFKLPQAFNFGENLVKIPGLDGSGKMGKSEGEGNAIFLCEKPESIRKKIMRAVSDSGPTTPNQEKPDAIKNLFQLMSVVSQKETLTFLKMPTTAVLFAMAI